MSIEIQMSKILTSRCQISRRPDVKILYGNNIELKIYILKIFCEEGIFRKNFQSSSKVPQRSSVDLYSPATETVTT